MLYRSILVLGLLSVVLCSHCQADDEPKKIALLVGVNEYDSEDVSDLRGCVNDVEAMKKLLLEEFSFKAEDIKTLTSARNDPQDKPDRPTKANIISGFRKHLIERDYGAKDIVVFYFAGHGSQMKDQDGDEMFDGKDETLVPCDSRLEGHFDIRDDEINGLFRELVAKGPLVTFVLDACHSGSGTRDVGRARSIPPDDRVPPVMQEWERSVRGAADADTRFEEQKYVLLSACRAEQKAREIFVNGSRHGVFTHFLVRSVSEANKESLTYDDVMDEVKVLVVKEVSNQEPQLEGALSNNLVFGCDSIVAHQHVLVSPVGNDLVVAAGKAHGMTENSVFKVYNPGTKKFVGPHVAKILIKEVNATTSTAVVSEGKFSDIMANSRAIETEHSFETDKFPIFLLRPADVLDPNGDPLIEGLKAHDAAPVLESIQSELENPKSDASKHFRISEMEDAHLLVGQVGNSIRFYFPTLEEIPESEIDVNDTDLVKFTFNQIGHWAKWRNVLGIVGPSASKVNLTLTFEKADGGATRAAGNAKNLKPSAKLESSDKINLIVENIGKTPLFFSVITMSTDGSVEVLYPPFSGDSEQLQPGKKVVIDDVEVYLPDGYDRVTDVQKVFATETKTNYEFLEMSRSRGVGIRGPNPPPFIQMLQESASLMRASRRRVKRDAWNTAEVVYDVEKKAKAGQE